MKLISFIKQNIIYIALNTNFNIIKNKKFF